MFRMIVLTTQRAFQFPVTAECIKPGVFEGKSKKEISSLEVGTNINNSPASCDIALISKFGNIQQLELYQKHPAHQKVVGFIKNTCHERFVVDYE